MNQNKTYTHTLRIYYEDTDAGGVVYHANYLKYMSRARVEFFRELGFEIDALSEQGFNFVVASAKLDFFHPATLNDVLTVRTQILKLGAASLDFSHLIQKTSRQSIDICRGEFKVACVDKDFKPCRISDRLRKAI